MFRIRPRGVFAALAVMAATVASVASAAAADPALNGKRLYMKRTCVACHGMNGAKAILNYPNLAGQNAAYLVQQMKDIGSGASTGSPDDTGNPRTAGMKAVMHLVSGDEMKVLADWLSEQKPAEPKPAELDPARVAAGEQLYNKRNCRSCHGPEGKKPLPAHPFIAGQKVDYIVNQMKDIREMVRLNGRSRTMIAFVKPLSDDDIQAIAEYLSQVKR